MTARAGITSAAYRISLSVDNTLQACGQSHF